MRCDERRWQRLSPAGIIIAPRSSRSLSEAAEGGEHPSMIQKPLLREARATSKIIDGLLPANPMQIEAKQVPQGGLYACLPAQTIDGLLHRIKPHRPLEGYANSQIIKDIRRKCQYSKPGESSSNTIAIPAITASDILQNTFAAGVKPLS